MEIELKLVKPNEREIISNLLQLYLHNLSAYFPIDFDSSKGMYIYDELDKYVEGNDSKAYFIFKEDKLTGFVLIDVTEEKNVIQEIFVLNNYKRQGIAGISVKKVFDMYKGNWEIKAVPCSKPAEDFWVKTVSEYTNDNYILEHTGKYNRAELRFNNR